MTNYNSRFQNLVAAAGVCGKLLCVVHCLDDDLETRLKVPKSLGFVGFGFGGLPFSILVWMLSAKTKVVVLDKRRAFQQVQWQLKIFERNFILDSDDWGDSALYAETNPEDIFCIIEMLQQDQRFEVKRI
jgi:hypothetical protein